MSQIDVVQGTLDYLVLRTLRGAGGPLHGFEILESIDAATQGTLAIEEGSLYPALHRMEKRGWLKATWGVSPKGRRAKYYVLTARGRTELALQDERWERYVQAVERIGAVAEEA